MLLTERKKLSLIVKNMLSYHKEMVIILSCNYTSKCNLDQGEAKALEANGGLRNQSGEAEQSRGVMYGV